MTTGTREELVEEVRERYARAARAATAGSAASCCEPAGTGGARAEPCCGAEHSGPCCSGEASGTAAVAFYDEPERAGLPDAALLASLGCGNPLAVADLREGETVLDLGSGGGIDVLLSARRVGPAGHAYGLDMTAEMLDLARQGAAEAGVGNVTFLEGRIEAVPLPDASVDVVISNCVVNLSVDKPAVFREMFRVLRPGGRVGVTDIVADDGLTTEQRAERGSYAGCVAGALSFAEYRAGLVAAGFTAVELELTHEVADGISSSIVRATKPA